MLNHCETSSNCQELNEKNFKMLCVSGNLPWILLGIIECTKVQRFSLNY